MNRGIITTIIAGALAISACGGKMADKNDPRLIALQQAYTEAVETGLDCPPTPNLELVGGLEKKAQVITWFDGNITNPGRKPMRTIEMAENWYPSAFELETLMNHEIAHYCMLGYEKLETPFYYQDVEITEIEGFRFIGKRGSEWVFIDYLDEARATLYSVDKSSSPDDAWMMWRTGNNSYYKGAMVMDRVRQITGIDPTTGRSLMDWITHLKGENATIGDFVVLIRIFEDLEFTRGSDQRLIDNATLQILDLFSKVKSE